MATALENCERTGHNFVLNRDATAFACSHGCGERRVRSVQFNIGPVVWMLLEFDDETRVREVYPSLRCVAGNRYEASRSDAQAILDVLVERASPNGGYEHTASDRRALRFCGERLREALAN